MSIQITSTTDSPEAVQAAMGMPKAGETKAEGAPAPAADKAAEQNESTESGTEDKEAEETEDENDESGEAEPGEGSEPSGAVEDKPRKKGGFQRRIDKLNTRVTAAQQEAEYWKQQALKGAAAAPKDELVVKGPAAAEGKPDPDKFDTHAEYVEALADWKTEQKLNERDQNLAKSKLEIEQATALKAHTDRVNAFKEKTEDFADVLSEVDDISVSPAIRELIVSSDNGPALMYELAKNRAEYERINKLPPLAAALELGKIESKIAAPEKKPIAKKPTKAPEPIAPVGSKGGSVEKSIYDPSLSQREYEALRAKQRAKLTG